MSDVLILYFLDRAVKLLSELELVILPLSIVIKHISKLLVMMRHNLSGSPFSSGLIFSVLRIGKALSKLIKNVAPKANDN